MLYVYNSCFAGKNKGGVTGIGRCSHGSRRGSCTNTVKIVQFALFDLGHNIELSDLFDNKFETILVGIVIVAGMASEDVVDRRPIW